MLIFLDCMCFGLGWEQYPSWNFSKISVLRDDPELYFWIRRATVT